MRWRSLELEGRYGVRFITEQMQSTYSTDGVMHAILLSEVK
jgi:hypothetical protein